MSSTELLSQQRQSNLIGTASDQFSEDLLSHEVIQVIVKGGLGETGLSRKYEKMGYGGAGADLVPGH